MDGDIRHQQTRGVHSAGMRCWHVIGLAVSVAFVGATVFWLVRRDNNSMSLPDVKHIVSAWLALGVYQEQPPIKSQLERSRVANILDALEPNRLDQCPMKWVEVGELHITLANGTTYSVLLYHTGDAEAAFSVSGKYYRGGSDKRLMSILEEVRRTDRDTHKERQK
ncbi:MAG: hypothetical protein ABFC63_02125 [Thermoguttaceae bacterium]